MSVSLKRYLTAVRNVDLVRRAGKVTQFFGMVVEASGPEVFLGEICHIYSRTQGAPIAAEVVGLRGGKVLLMPYGELRGICLGSEVIATGHGVHVPVGDALLGRVIDAFGMPLDGKPLERFASNYPISTSPLNPLARRRITRILETGVKAIDCFLTTGRGQRVGIMSGSGVGKSALLGMIARHMDADVNVIALIGERGREVRDFIEDTLGAQGMQRSVVVVATSDQPALVRCHAAYAATAIAEYFRNCGKHVVLTMDSLTRYAMAQREIGLAIGEPPTARGYTPSVFASLPRLLERAGAAESGGSITAFYTVLVEGDDLSDPIADTARAILDGHIALSRESASRGHYPAIDLTASISRLMADLVDADELAVVRSALGQLVVYLQAKDMIDVGAYRAGSNSALDKAVKLYPSLQRFLAQPVAESIGRTQAMQILRDLIHVEGESK